MMDIMYDIPSQEETSELLVTGEMIAAGAENSDNEDEFLRKRA